MRILKSLFAYSKELITRWYALLGLLPGIYELVTLYLPQFKIISIPLKITIFLAVMSFILANYLSWKKLWDENNELKDKEPKLDLNFDNDKKELLIQSKIKIKKLIEKRENPQFTQLGIVNNILKSVSSSFQFLSGSPIENKIIKEISEEYIPVSVVLINNGNSVASKVYVDIVFPKDIKILEKLPSGNSLLLNSVLHSKKEFTFVNQEDNSIQLHVNESQHPYKTEFPEFYIRCDKNKEFHINYVINAKEVRSNKIKGSLIFKSEPIIEEEIIHDKEIFNEEVSIKEGMISNEEE